MIYVSSDWHGVPLEKIQKLLSLAHFSDDDYLFVLGDVIDRGDHGIALIKWLMVQPNMLLLRGNHEDMLLACEFLFVEDSERNNQLSPYAMRAYQSWKNNGSSPTITALLQEPAARRKAIMQFLRETPLYDTVSAGGRDYVLVHAGLGNFDEDRPLEDYHPDELLWVRPDLSKIYSRRFITIVGHTPTWFYAPESPRRMVKTDTWWDIDTGAAGGGTPMLLCLDTLQETYLDE